MNCHQLLDYRLFSYIHLCRPGSAIIQENVLYKKFDLQQVHYLDLVPPLILDYNVVNHLLHESKYRILSFVPLALAHGLSINPFMLLILLIKFHPVFSERHKALHILYMHH